MTAPKNLTKRQLAAIELLRVRLDPAGPLFSGADCVKQALGGEAKLYFTSHVLPLLNFLLEGEQFYGQAEAIKRDLSSRKSAVRRAAQQRLERERLASAGEADLHQLREDRAASPAGQAVRDQLGI